MTRGLKRIAQKERAILDAARHVFVKKGYQGSKVAEIAKVAGISEGSLYFYFAKKDDLMHALLESFWEDLTIGAIEAVDPTSGTFEQAVSLAKYHLDSLIGNFEFIDLHLTLRGNRKTPAGSRVQMRKYVCVLDEIIRRGIDRGVIRPDVEIWIVRDVFYGSLDYAARSLTSRAGHRSAESDRIAVHLVSQIFELHGLRNPQDRQIVSGKPCNDNSLDRLKSIAIRLEAALMPGRASRTLVPEIDARVRLDGFVL